MKSNKMPKEMLMNLQSCFEGKEQVHISEIATWVGKRTAIKAHKYADANGYVKLK